MRPEPFSALNDNSDGKQLSQSWLEESKTCTENRSRYWLTELVSKSAVFLKEKKKKRGIESEGGVHYRGAQQDRYRNNQGCRKKRGERMAYSVRPKKKHDERLKEAW